MKSRPLQRVKKQLIGLKPRSASDWKGDYRDRFLRIKKGEKADFMGVILGILMIALPFVVIGLRIFYGAKEVKESGRGGFNGCYLAMGILGLIGLLVILFLNL